MDILSNDLSTDGTKHNSLDRRIVCRYNCDISCITRISKTSLRIKDICAVKIQEFRTYEFFRITNKSFC